MKLTVRNLDNQEVGDIELAEEVFGLPVRRDILARVVNWHYQQLYHTPLTFALITPGIVTLAVAPTRCFTFADIETHPRLWGLAVQLYGLRRPGDCGIGDAGGVSACASTTASSGRFPSQTDERAADRTVESPDPSALQQ